MTVRYERPVSRAAYRARGLAYFAALMTVIAWVAHRFGPLDTPYFVAILAAAGLIAALSVYLAMIGLVMLWTKGAKGGMAALKALIAAILPLAPALAGVIFFVTRPELYDVSSDTVDPPPFVEAVVADQSWLGARPAPTATDRETQMLFYRGVTGRRYEGALDRVYTAARKVAEASGIDVRQEIGAPELTFQDAPSPNGKLAAEDAVPDELDAVPVPVPRPESTLPDESALPAGDAYIQGVHRTLVFGFRQDVVIRLREEAETTLVDIRVASRYGRHDLGTGAAFIEAYLRALDAELLGIAGD
jgi:hypothetical protein